MIYLKEKTISYDDICLVPQYSDLRSRSEAVIEQHGFRNPISNSPMIHTSSKELLRFMNDNNMMTNVHRYFKSAEDQICWVKSAIQDDYKKVYFSVGKDTAWIDTLIDSGVTRFLVDMAHGDSITCIETIKYIKSIDKNAEIVAGNVATREGYKRLVDAGASKVRCIIASGSICSTAKNTAFGVPAATTILDCSEIKKEVGGQIIADGGIRSAADILKAIACGADFVYCGKLLASTNLAEGPFFYTDGITKCSEPELSTYVQYAGMASHEMRMRNASHETKNVSIEGVSGLIKYTGQTEEVFRNIEANLKAGLSYCGARNWKEFYDFVVIREMSTAGIIEKDTHLDAYK